MNKVQQVKKLIDSGFLFFEIPDDEQDLLRELRDNYIKWHNSELVSFFYNKDDTDKNVELRAINRQIKLISKIDQALKKITDGTYGFCEETGEPIGIKRLMARPIASLCITAQEKHEKEEKVYADL